MSDIGIRLVKRLDLPLVFETAVAVGTFTDIENNFLLGVGGSYQI